MTESIHPMGELIKKYEKLGHKPRVVAKAVGVMQRIMAIHDAEVARLIATMIGDKYPGKD